MADCHVGCRQYGMKEREEDFYRALGTVRELAKSENVDAVVIAGDLFDSPKPPSRAVYEVRRFVDDLEKSGIEVLGVEGNHDLTGSGYWLRVCGVWPLALMHRDVKGCRFVGCDYERSDQLLDSIEGRIENADVLVLHAGFVEMGDSFNSDLSAEAVSRLVRDRGVKYVATGHIHIPMEQVHDGILFVQPGSLEMKSLDEPQDKSVQIVDYDVSEHRVASVRRVPYATRQVHFVNIDTAEDIDRMVSEVTAKKVGGRFVVAYVSASVDGGLSRVEDWLRSEGLMFRAVPTGDKSDVGEKGYDRSNAMVSLKDAVDAFFEEGDERHALVMAILATNNVRQVVEDFLNGKEKNDDQS